jgi:hypothetical protein
MVEDASAAGPAQSGASPEAAQFLAQAAGVYKTRFQNETVTDGRYTAENILEVVPVDEHSAYVRLHLEFYNGHIAAFWGVASYVAPDSLVYAYGEGDDYCVITVAWTQDKVTTSADESKTPGCRLDHGVRASFDAHFARSQRRDIRYLERLKNSPQYQGALAAYARKPGAR